MTTFSTHQNQSKRETRLMSILHYVSSSVWKSLFGKSADSLERSIDHADEFMIVDYEPITSTFVSVPSDLGQLSADAYLSGIIAGVLDGAGFSARVTAHSVKIEEGEVPAGGGGGGFSVPGMPPRKEKAVFLVKFSPGERMQTGVHFTCCSGLLIMLIFLVYFSCRSVVTRCCIGKITVTFHNF